jgi:biotin-independent malonate decarboxylase beta subunit
MCSAFRTSPEASIALRPVPALQRIAVIADPFSIAPVDEALSAPRPSPHLARWGIKAQDDDGVVIARATIRGAPVFVAAQDERFLGGSAGVRHADAMRGMFDRARAERPAAVLILAASGGVRLHEANPAELALARTLASLLDLRVAGVRVLCLVAADVFGGASVVACAADRIAMLPGTRLGLSGPTVIEMARGRGEFDAGDRAAVVALFGAQARADAGQVELVADDTEVVREWVAQASIGGISFAADVEAMQARLGGRLLGHRMVDAGSELQQTAATAPASNPLSSIYAEASRVDRHGWLWRVPGTTIWLTHAPGAGTVGPRDAHALDAALLEHLADSDEREKAILFVVSDSDGHEATAAAEALLVSQYLAQHAAVLALLRSRGVRTVGLLAGTGHSAAFFSSALQAPRVHALTGARVVAMEPATIARVTGLDSARLAKSIEDDPLVGHPVRHFAAWGGIASILPDASRARLLDTARDELARPRS